MPKETSEDDKARTLSAYAQGLSYSEIAEYSGVSASNAHNIVSEARGRIHDLDVLRGFYVDMKKKNLAPVDAQHSIAAQDRLDKINMTLDNTLKAVEFLEETGYNEKTRQYITAGIEMKKLEDNAKLPCDKLLEWYRFTEPRRESEEKQIRELVKQKHQLEQELQDLNELKSIKNILTAKGVILPKLTTFLENFTYLEHLGFTQEIASLFATELSKTNMSPEAAANRIATILAQSKTLEEQINKLTSQKDALQKQKEYLETEITGKKNLLIKVENNIETTLGNEEELINQEAKKFKDKAKIEKDAIMKDLTEDIEKLEALVHKIAERQKEKEALEAGIEDTKYNYIFGMAIIQILRDPSSTSLVQLRKIYETSKKAIEHREKELFNLASSDTKETSVIIAKTLIEYAKQEIVLKTDYDRLKFSNERNENEKNELKKRVTQLENKIDASAHAYLFKTESEINRLNSMDLQMKEYKNTINLQASEMEKIKNTNYDNKSESAPKDKFAEHLDRLAEKSRQLKEESKEKSNTTSHFVMRSLNKTKNDNQTENQKQP